MRIERMLRGVFENERAIKESEDAEDGPALMTARGQRDAHILDVKHAIDYSLNTLGYEDAPCTACVGPVQFPADTVGFIRAVGGDECTRAILVDACKTCRDLRVVRSKKSDPESQAAIKRISYFSKVLETTVLCAKVRARTTEASDAYLALERAHMNIVTKFANEKQTSMEGEDAEQGAKMGIFDAALRFDPTRPEMAQFPTVAYNWAYRNSRARRDGEKRAGVYAQSVDAMVNQEDGSKFVDTVCAGESGFGSFVPQEGDQTLTLDMREKILGLPHDERRVIMALMTGHTLSTAAEHLGLRRAKVKQLRDQAYEGLRSSLGGYVEAVRD